MSFWTLCLGQVWVCVCVCVGGIRKQFCVQERNWKPSQASDLPLLALTGPLAMSPRRLFNPQLCLPRWRSSLPHFLSMLVGQAVLKDGPVTRSLSPNHTVWLEPQGQRFSIQAFGLW